MYSFILLMFYHLEKVFDSTQARTRTSVNSVTFIERNLIEKVNEHSAVGTHRAQNIES